MMLSRGEWRRTLPEGVRLSEVGSVTRSPEGWRLSEVGGGAFAGEWQADKRHGMGILRGGASKDAGVGEGEMAVIREAVVDSRAERLRISRLRSIKPYSKHGW